MSTETEIVLQSLTDEELDDAVRWLEVVLGQWQLSRAAIEARYGDRRPEGEVLAATDGPIHLIRAMDLAVIRERAQRGGAEPWYAGMSLEGHPAATYVRHYQQRIALNPDNGHKPRLSAAGVLEKVCAGCRESKPLTVAFWPWLGSSIDDVCRTCRNPVTAAEVAVEQRQAAIEAQEAAAPAALPVEPFTADDVVPVPDDSLAML